MPDFPNTIPLQDNPSAPPPVNNAPIPPSAPLPAAAGPAVQPAGSMSPLQATPPGTPMSDSPDRGLNSGPGDTPAGVSSVTLNDPFSDDVVNNATDARQSLLENNRQAANAGNAPTLNIDSWMKQRGLSLAGADPINGSFQVKDQNGNIGDVSVNQILRSKGVPAELHDKFHVQFNTQDNPLPSSPFSTLDRVKMSAVFSNPKGVSNYISSQGFSDIDTTNEHGMVVQKNGVWSQVDPSFFGKADPWKIAEGVMDWAHDWVYKANTGQDRQGNAVSYLDTILPTKAIKETAKQVIPAVKGAYNSMQRPDALGELSSDMIASAPSLLKGMAEMGAGAAAGAGTLAATNNPNLALAAGSLASGGTAAAIKTPATILGKIWGTYDNTVDGQAADVLFDAAITTAGYPIAVGTQAVMSQVWDGIKFLADKGSNVAKTAFTSQVSKASGKSVAIIENMLDHENFIPVQKEVLSKIDSTNMDDIKAVTVPMKKAVIDPLFEMAPKIASSNYKAGMEAVMANSPDAAISKETYAEGFNEAAKKLGMGQFFPEKNGKYVFQAFSGEQREALRQSAQDGAEVIAAPMMDELLPYMKQMENHLNDRSNSELKGKAAASSIVDFIKGINFVAKDGLADDTRDQISRVEAKFAAAAKGSIGENLGDQDSIKAYMKVNQDYSKVADVTRWAKWAYNKDNKTEMIARDYLNPGAKFDTKEKLQSLFDLMPDGKNMQTRLDMVHTAEQTAQWFPNGKFTGFTGLATAGSTGASLWAHNPIAAAGVTAAGTAVAAQSSPRIAQIEGIAFNKFSQTIKSLDKATASKIFSDPHLFGSFVLPVMTSGKMKDEIQSQITSDPNTNAQLLQQFYQTTNQANQQQLQQIKDRSGNGNGN